MFDDDEHARHHHTDIEFISMGSLHALFSFTRIQITGNGYGRAAVQLAFD